MTQKDGIVVTGDLAVNWFELTIPPPVFPAGSGSGQRTVPADPSVDDSLVVNWQGFTQVVRCASPGGALMLADCVKAAMRGAVPVIAPQVVDPLDSIPASDIIHSYATLTRASTREPWYLAEHRGYAGPDDGVPRSLDPASRLVRWPQIKGTPGLVVVDDGGNGFRRAPGLFPSCPPETVVIYKLHPPLTRGPLWSHLEGTAGDGRAENLVVVVNADDLRMAPEVNISSGLSWERTARELLSQIRLNPHLEQLGRCRNLMVVLDTDAVFVYHCGLRPLARLVFDPKRWEGGFRAEIKRNVVGLTNAFSAALAAHIYQSEGRLEELHEAARAGLIAARRTLLAGYSGASTSVRIAVEKVFDFGDKSIVPEKLGWDGFASAFVPPSTSLLEPDPDYWRMLESRTRNISMRVAENLVRNGKHPVMEEVPELRVGGLVTSDRSEIESYSAVRKLLTEYLDGKDEQPLSIAVFGAPGSGKSFGVKQVGQSVGVTKDAVGTVNLSQLGSADGLNSAFHRIRDIGLTGRVPLFFFDEFDCRDLDWLKLFLAPMQDGEFEDRGVNYRLGRCILVFAGGTSATFEAFAARQQQCKAQKLPDFISRLRGFINIMGPNPRIVTDTGGAAPRTGDSGGQNGKTSASSLTDAETATEAPAEDSTASVSASTVAGATVSADVSREGAVSGLVRPALKSELDDPGYVIRRAKLWRSLMERSKQAQNLFHGKELNIDPGLLRALLRVPRYKHGIRSMAAILQMSRLSGKKRFDKSDLPPREQLALHVDVDDFFFLLERERFTNNREAEAFIVDHLARVSHQRYVRSRLARKQPLKVSVDYDALELEKQESNRDLAKDIPQKLRTIGLWFRPIAPGEPARSPIIREDEIEQLARREHQRWEREQRYQGVTVHECFRPFECLPPEVQDYDREIVLGVPCLLSELGLEVVREEELDDFPETELVEALAREIHRRYAKEREKQGETTETNPALVTYEKLPDDIQRSNHDNASHIPTKLKAIGYGMRRVPPGRKPKVLELQTSEIETMARMEHERWVWERLMSGWIYAAGAKNIEQKTSPYMVPYDKLTNEIQEYDRETVRVIPDLLSSIGYEVYRPLGLM